MCVRVCMRAHTFENIKAEHMDVLYVKQNIETT